MLAGPLFQRGIVYSNCAYPATGNNRHCKFQSIGLFSSKLIFHLHLKPFSLSRSLCSQHPNVKAFAQEDENSSAPGPELDKVNTFDDKNSFTGINSENEVASSKTPSQSAKVLQKLRRYGVSGVLSYGLLNTVYYLGTFLFVWFYVTPAPGGLGYSAAIQRIPNP